MNPIIEERIEDLEKKVGKEVVYPINFCIPKELLLSTVPEKKKQFGTVIPGNMSTYIFDDQQKYYEDYQDSYFGYTWKKGQWDTIRTQEIMMNGCIPLFMDIDKCPKYSLMHHDKLRYQKIRDNYEKFGTDEYQEHAQWALNYCYENLTTEAMAQFVLNTVGAQNAKNVLFITLGDQADHLNDFMFHGFRSILGKGLVETNKLWWMYKDIHEGYTYRGTGDDRKRIDETNPNISQKDKDGLIRKKVKVNELRGKAFTYSNHLEDILVDRENIEDKINERYFDLIIYGSIHRCDDYFELVSSKYDKEKILILDVDDDIVNKKQRPDAFLKYKNKGIYFCTDLTSIIEL